MFKKLSLFVVAAASIGGAHSAAMPNVDGDLALRGDLVARSGAAQTCTLWSLQPNTANLAASCTTADGSSHFTVVEISSCVGNQNGNLGCQKNGGAGGSCVFYDIEYAPFSFFTISAHCNTRDGGILTTEHFDMIRARTDACLTNTNGNLGC
ncbi:hypothetical protein B0H10DRAFT_1940370 [Mycena sp. CBHHK59/15]|nr:hypothetical protein B0H10DRAFT_1940370 [Mycena sp. CBHHK59/15]